MATYRCEQCDTWKDDDWFPCEQHPNYENEQICPECKVELDDQKAGRAYEIEQMHTAWSLEQEKKRG